MVENDLTKLTISELAPQIKARKVSPVEVTEAALSRVEELQPIINSFITILSDEARKQAKIRETEIAKGNYLGPLDGIPIGIKDNIATKGIRSTVGSKVLADYFPEEDAHIVGLCKAAGAIILGKENMHEFAAGGTSDNPHYGPVRNPWKLDRVPGGSSGGGAANVAAGVTYASLGTDLGGSVRGPAAYSGVVGLKQTFGRVSQRGLMVTYFHGDHIGPMTRSVEDSAIVLQTIAGYDPLDPSTVPVPVPDYSARLGDDITGLTIGIPKNHFFEILDPEVRAAVDEAIQVLQNRGAKLREVSLESMQYVPALQGLLLADRFVLHEPNFYEQRSLYSPELSNRLLAGQFVLARDYIKGIKVQRLLQEEFLSVLQQVDVLAWPTTVCPAFPIGATSILIDGVDYPIAGSAMTITNRNNFVGNMTGLPSISLPCGFNRDQLPLALQLMGRPFEEARLFQMAAAYENDSPAKGVWPTMNA